LYIHYFPTGFNSLAFVKERRVCSQAGTEFSALDFQELDALKV
jgi:hypothetical protein